MFLIKEDELEYSMQLRVEEPTVNQPSINWANDYKFDARWPPSEVCIESSDIITSTLNFLKSKDVDIIDASKVDTQYDAILRSPSDELYRLIIRSGSVQNGRLRFDTGNQHTPESDEIDYILINSDELDELCLVDRSDYNCSFSLRVDEPKQAQPNINWAEDYRFFQCWPPDES